MLRLIEFGMLHNYHNNGNSIKDIAEAEIIIDVLGNWTGNIKIVSEKISDYFRTFITFLC